MDKTTKAVKRVHDMHARRISKDGEYLPHQPIYGFSPLAIDEYYRIYAIANVFGEFKSFADIGCAEGMYMSIAMNRTGASVVGLDLSTEILKRMWEYFGYAGMAGDSASLPFKNSSFDVVLCSEVLEHMTEPLKAVKELKRIGKKIVITTPIAKNEKEKTAFVPDVELKGNTHLHFFDRADMEKMFGHVSIRYAQSTILYPLNIIYRRFLRFLDALVDFPMATMLIKADAWLCKKYPWSGKVGIVVCGNGKDVPVPAGFIVSGLYRKISEQRKTSRIRLQNKKTFVMKEYGYLVSVS